MSFQVRQETRQNTIGLDPTVYVLEDGVDNGIEIWPAHGFNCYRWHVDGHELLYAAPEFFDDPKPTRSGIPILFPFPNRIRAGRFSWAGKHFELPVNDTPSRNAIHGFACRHPWRVLEISGSDDEAFITGEFQISADAPQSLEHWPGDAGLRLTYRLARNRLSLEATVINPGGTPLPCGLGYHPYFTIPFLNDPDGAVTVPADTVWELQESLPTSRKIVPDVARDLRGARKIADVQLDDVYTDFPPSEQGDRLQWRGTLRGGNAGLQVWTSPGFRELVAFTPIHGKAICLEPYTCVTDAINLQQQGVDAGLITLAPGETWSGTVLIVLDSLDGVTQGVGTSLRKRASETAEIG